MSLDKIKIDLVSQKAKKRSIEDIQPCPSSSDGKGSEMKKKKKKKKKERNIDDMKPIQNTSECNGSEMKKKKKKKKRQNIDNTENTSDCNGSQIKKKRNIDDTKPIQNTSDCNGSEMKKKKKKKNMDNTENTSDCNGSQIKKKRNIDDTKPISNTSDCNGSEIKKKKKKKKKSNIVNTENIPDCNGPQIKKKRNIDNTENTSDCNGSQIKKKRNIDDTKPIQNTSNCNGSEMKKKKKKKKKRNIDNMENTSDCNGSQIKKMRNIESEPCTNTSDGNSTEVKKKKKKNKKRHAEKSALVHITPDDAKSDLNDNSEQTSSRTERETSGLISDVNSSVKRDLKRKRKKVHSGNEPDEEVVKKKRNVDKELSANMTDDSALRKAKKKKKKKHHKEKLSVTSNDSVVDPGLVIKVEENINLGETSTSVCSTNVNLLSEKTSGTPDRISPSYIGYADCMSGVSKRKKRKSSSMNGESMNKVAQHLVDKFEFCPTSSDEGSMKAPAEQKKHSKNSYTDTSVSKKKKKRKKQVEESQCSPSGEKGSQDHRGSRKPSQEGSVSDKAKSNDDKEMSISGFEYSLVAVEKNDDSNTDANGKKKRVMKKKTTMIEEEKQPKFESWNENCILLPEEISELVHENKCRLTQADRQHNHKMGIRFREGYFTEREDEILKKNFEEYLKFNPVDEPWKLLFATQTTEPVKYKRICKETNFYIQLAGRLNRPTNACYFRARTLLFPGKTNGRFTEEEDQLLSELQSKQAGHWMRSGMEMGRTAQALFNRWKKIQKNNIRKEKDYNAGKWNEEENERLMQALKDEVGQEENVFSKELLTKIRWIEIAKKVQTRDLMSCYRHWAYLVATQTEEGEATKCRWATQDSDKLIQMVYELDIEFKDEIDWRSLLPHFPSSQTVETLKRKWADLCRVAPRYTEMSFNELREWLYEFKRKNKNKKGS